MSIKNIKREVLFSKEKLITQPEYNLIQLLVKKLRHIEFFLFFE